MRSLMLSLPLGPRRAVAGALSLTARGLEVGALAAKLVAQRLGQGPAPSRPRRDEGPGPVRVVPTRLTPPAEEEPRPGRVSQPPTMAVPMVDQHARTYESHTAELADKPAAQLVRAIRDLSTDELRALYEHEQANKRRKSVLKEIESQLAPVG